jgi:flagellar L-ring protein precursor FlgH
MKKKIMSADMFRVSFLALIFLSGCVGNSPKTPIMPERYSLPQVDTRQPTPAEGALFSDQAMDIYKDNRACRVGDILLVEIVESSRGKNDARTKTERESTVEGGISQFFGFEKWLSGKNANYTPGKKSLSVDLTNDFEGIGDTSRNSTVTATISARVIEVTMEGNLVIQGYRETKVNHETQFIILSGLVRPRDITANNSIKSTHIANARIEYSGTGIVSDKQQPGWLARSVDVLWPF